MELPKNRLIRIQFEPSINLKNKVPHPPGEEPHFFYSRKFDAITNHDARISRAETLLRRRGNRSMQLANIQSIRLGDEHYPTVLRCPIIGKKWQQDIHDDLAILDERRLYMDDECEEIDEFYGLEIVYPAGSALAAERSNYRPKLLALGRTVVEAAVKNQPIYSVNKPRLTV